jgi:mRNA-degrading endonuclease toxin of MazEF toxin-antitoxin module
MKTRRGDVVLVLFPNSDLRTAKRRPALVLQRDNLASGLGQTIVAMISSNLARRGHPSRIFKPQGVAVEPSGRERDTKRITPLFSSPPLSWRR